MDGQGRADPLIWSVHMGQKRQCRAGGACMGQEDGTDISLMYGFMCYRAEQEVWDRNRVWAGWPGYLARQGCMSRAELASCLIWSAFYVIEEIYLWQDPDEYISSYLS